jgi:hypothetical protein
MNLKEGSSTDTGFPAPERLSLYPRYSLTAVATTKLEICQTNLSIEHRTSGCPGPSIFHAESEEDVIGRAECASYRSQAL